MNKHLYIGGMWFKKLQYIEGGYTSPVTQYPDHKDYRDNHIGNIGTKETLLLITINGETPQHKASQMIPASISTFRYGLS